MTDFHDSLKRLAGVHGLTAKELALALGVSAQSVSELVNGKREPGTKTLMQIRELFEVDPLRMHDGFDEILPEVADRERFKRVEKKLQKQHRELVRRANEKAGHSDLKVVR